MSDYARQGTISSPIMCPAAVYRSRHLCACCCMFSSAEKEHQSYQILIPSRIGKPKLGGFSASAWFMESGKSLLEMGSRYHFPLAASTQSSCFRPAPCCWPLASKKCQNKKSRTCVEGHQKQSFSRLWYRCYEIPDLAELLDSAL